jgi:hypothetical protein
MIRARYSAEEFVRLHRLMLSHLALGTAAAWSVAVYAGLNAPWVGNIVFLIDPTSSSVQTTGSYLFTFPAILLIALGIVYFGRDTIFRLRLLRNQAVEFAVVGAALFTVFVLSIERAAAALRLGWL